MNELANSANKWSDEKDQFYRDVVKLVNENDGEAEYIENYMAVSPHGTPTAIKIKKMTVGGVIDIMELGAFWQEAGNGEHSLPIHYEDIGDYIVVY